jgi:hypothetical protein
MTFKLQKKALLVFPVLVFVVLTQTVVSAPAVPKPVLYILGTETFHQAGKDWIRYKYDVFNKADYPAEMFTPAPDLPPCGKNTNASRTWVDVYDQNGKRLNGFCDLLKPVDLRAISFALESGELPPNYVYIELTDRKTNTKYKSNLAETTL